MNSSTYFYSSRTNSHLPSETLHHRPGIRLRHSAQNASLRSDARVLLRVQGARRRARMLPWWMYHGQAFDRRPPIAALHGELQIAALRTRAKLTFPLPLAVQGRLHLVRAFLLPFAGQVLLILCNHCGRTGEQKRYLEPRTHFFFFRLAELVIGGGGGGITTSPPTASPPSCC